jgi:polyphosphate kinase
MPRNLDKRVELVVPVEDAECRGRLVDLFSACFKDTTNSWQLHPTGAWKRQSLTSSKKAFRCQETLYKEAVRTLRQTRQRKRTAFEPYKAGE